MRRKLFDETQVSVIIVITSVLWRDTYKDCAPVSVSFVKASKETIISRYMPKILTYKEI